MDNSETLRHNAHVYAELAQDYVLFHALMIASPADLLLQTRYMQDWAHV
jgi:hypothetical protein